MPEIDHPLMSRGDILKVKSGVEFFAGHYCVVVGTPFKRGQWWVPIVWEAFVGDESEDPDLIKASCLERMSPKDIIERRKQRLLKKKESRTCQKT